MNESNTLNDNAATKIIDSLDTIKSDLKNEAVDLKEVITDPIKKQIENIKFMINDDFSNIKNMISKHIPIVSKISLIGKASLVGITEFKEYIKNNSNVDVINTADIKDVAEDVSLPILENEPIIEDIIVKDEPIAVEKETENIKPDLITEFNSKIGTPDYMKKDIPYTYEDLVNESGPAIKPITAAITPAIEPIMPEEHPDNAIKALEEMEKESGNKFQKAKVLLTEPFENKTSMFIRSIPKLIKEKIKNLFDLSFEQSNTIKKYEDSIGNESKVLTDEEINNGVNEYLERLNKQTETTLITEPKNPTFKVIDNRIDPETFYEVKAELDARKENTEQPKTL